MSLALGIERLHLGNKTLVEQAISVLRKFGTSAHAYIPGIGTVSGLASNNFVLSDGSSGYSPVDGLQGLVLDGMGSVGSELVSNPGPSFVNTTGWSVFNCSASIVSGKFRSLSTISGIGARMATITVTGLTVGATYAISGSGSAVGGAGAAGSPNSFFLRNSTDTVTIGSVTQGNTGYFVATETTQLVRMRWDGDASTTTASYVDFDYVTLKPYSGIHATSSGAAPPLRRGAYNYLTYSNDFSNAAWIKGGAATTPSANKVIFTASVADKVTHTTPAASSSVGMRWTWSVELSGSGTCSLFIYDDGGAFPGNAGGLITLTSTPTRYYATRTHSDATATKMAVQITNPSSNAITITATNAQLEVGTTASDYTPTTSAAASNPLAGRYSSQFAGAQSLALGSVPWTSADDQLVIVGGSVSSTNVSSLFGGNGAGTQRCPALYVSSLGTVINARWTDDAAADSTSSLAGIAIGTSFIATARKSGNNKYVRLNGAQSAVNATAIATTTLTNAAIGFAAGAYHTGFIGPTILIKGTVTDSECLTLERFIASLTPNSPSF